MRKWESKNHTNVKVGHTSEFLLVFIDELEKQLLKKLLKWANEKQITKTKTDIIILHMCTMHTIIWCMVPEIWSVIDKIFCHFGSFFCPFTFCPFKSKFWKTEKNTKRYHHLHKYTKNRDHMLYCSLDMALNGFNYFSFWATFYPFTSLKAQKIKI